MKATSVMEEREKLTTHLREGWTIQTEGMVWMMREINQFRNEKGKLRGVLKMIKVELGALRTQRAFKCPLRILIYAPPAKVTSTYAGVTIFFPVVMHSNILFT